MLELPDITVYVEALEQRVLDQTLNRIRISNPFLVRSVEPSVAEAEGHRVTAVRRLGKRIALGLDNDIWILIHLMMRVAVAAANPARFARPPSSRSDTPAMRRTTAPDARLMENFSRPVAACRAFWGRTGLNS